MSVPALVWIDSIHVGNTVAKALLRYLATHNFMTRGFYFKNSTYMAALEISEKTLQRAFSHLEQNNFITIERRFNEHGRQISNGIYLNIPQEFIDSYEERIREGVKLSDPKNSPVKMTTLGASDCRPPPRQDDVPYNNNKNNNKLNRERAPLSDDFIPNKGMDSMSHDVANRCNTTPDKLLFKFKNLMKSSGKVSIDWDAEYGVFLGRERPEKTITNTTTSTNIETHSTVPMWKSAYTDIQPASDDVINENMLKIKQMLSRKIINGSEERKVQGADRR